VEPTSVNGLPEAVQFFARLVMTLPRMYLATTSPSLCLRANHETSVNAYRNTKGPILLKAITAFNTYPLMTKEFGRNRTPHFDDDPAA